MENSEYCSTQPPSRGQDKENLLDEESEKPSRRQDKENLDEEIESESDLEGFSIEEMDVRIAKIQGFINTFQLKLEVRQRVRRKKLESFTLS